MTGFSVPNAYEHICACGWALKTTVTDEDGLYERLVSEHKCPDTWQKQVSQAVMMLGFFATVCFFAFLVYRTVT